MYYFDYFLFFLIRCYFIVKADKKYIIVSIMKVLSKEKFFLDELRENIIERFYEDRYDDS